MSLDACLVVLLCLHVLLLVVAPRTRRYLTLKRAAFVCGGLVVCLSLALGPPVWAGSRSILVTAGATAIASQLTLLGALWSCQYSWRRAIQLLPACYRWSHIRQGAGIQYALIIALAIYEEIIWRRELLGRLGSSPTALLTTALLFYASHVVVSRKIRIPRLIDIVLFSLALGLLFAMTASLVAVAVAHAIRNLQLFALRYARDPTFRVVMETSALRLTGGLIATRAPVSAPEMSAVRHGAG